MKRRNVTVLLSGMLMLVSGIYPACAAEEYPTKPITFIMPWPAGGGTDVGLRIVMNIAQEKLGVPIIVTNKAGAGSQTGLTELSRVKPDGYTIGNANMPHINTIILDPVRNASFGLDDFVPLINQVKDPGMIWVVAESPYKTLQDLMDDAKKRPGEIRASVGGPLSDDHLATLLFEQVTGVKFRHVHAEGIPEAVAAMLGGHVDFTFGNVGDIYATLLKSEQARALAIADNKRSEFLPDVPTTVELGIPVVASATRGIVVPKGIPEPIMDKLEQVFADAMATPEHMEKMKAVGMAINPMRREEYGKFYRDTHLAFKPLVDAVRAGGKK